MAPLEPTDITVEILKDIRQEVRKTREDLSDRIDLAGTVVDMTRVLRASHDLRPRAERCELEIAELRRQVGGR